MTKTDALNLIDQLIAAFKGTRQEHELLRQAYEVLSRLEEPKLDKK